MKMTLQDIIDKEFKVKFRGFDMVEVDTFLEEVAEVFFKLNEENTLLNEKVLALQQDLEAAGSMATPGQAELPAELGNLLEDLKQDTAAIGAELTSLKHDRHNFDSLEKNLTAAIASIQEAATETKPQSQLDIPAELASTLEELIQGSLTVAAELEAFKKDRQALDSLKKSLEEAIASVKSAAPTKTHQNQGKIPGDLGKTLEDFNQASKTMGAELAGLKNEITSFAKMREDIKGELQELLTSGFAELDAKIATIGGKAGHAATKTITASPAPDQNKKLPTARIEEEPEELSKDTRLPDYREEDEDQDDAALEFLNEDDILDVDKLRGIFQSVLDEGISDGHQTRDGDDTEADLLFLEEDFIEDDHEPKVTFSLNEKETAKNPN
jgi:DivIVA domain-containing protein